MDFKAPGGKEHIDHIIDRTGTEKFLRQI